MCNAEQEQFPAIPHILEYCGHQEVGKRDASKPVEICEITPDGSQQLLCGPAPWNAAEEVCIETNSCTLKDGLANGATASGSAMSTYTFRGQKYQLGGKVAGLGGCDRAVNMLKSECWKWDDSDKHCVVFKASEYHSFEPIYSDAAHAWMAPGSVCSAVTTSTRAAITNDHAVPTERVTLGMPSTIKVELGGDGESNGGSTTMDNNKSPPLSDTEGAASSNNGGGGGSSSSNGAKFDSAGAGGGGGAAGDDDVGNAAGDATANGDVHSRYWPLIAIVVASAFTFWAMKHTYKAHPLRMKSSSDLLGCLRVYVPALRRGETYRRLDFEDDLAYEYDSYELDAAAADADFAIDPISDDEFDRVEDEADEILRKAAAKSTSVGAGGGARNSLTEDLLEN